MQKFFLGDLVRIADDLGVSMSHFPSGQDAVVLYSYSEKYGRGSAANDKCIGLFILKGKDKGEHAWYYDAQLTLIEEDRLDLLPKSNEYRWSYDAKLARKKQMENGNG